jgi:hypothetical protein
MKWIGASFIVAMLFLAVYVSAESVNSIEYPVAFVELTKGGEEYMKTIDFTPPDGVAKIISAVVTVQGDFDVDNQVYVTLNKQPCEPPTWKVSMSAKDVASVGYKMTFDCTNVLALEKSGSQDVAFLMDLPAKNVNAIYKITYYTEPGVTLEDINKKLDNQSIIENINKIVSKPKIDLSLHGTEYSAGDINGKVFLQLLNDSEEPITNTSCFIKLFYPNTTTFVSTTLMNNFTEGLHYYDFAVPETLGVYMASAFCYIPDPVNVIARDNFECGSTTFNCGTGWTSNWTTVGSVEIISTLSPAQGLWHMRLNGGATNAQAERTVNTNLTGCTNGYLIFYARASGLEVGESCYYKLNTGTQNITLLAIANPNDDNTYRYYSFEICQYNLTGSPKIILNDTGINTDDICYIDDVQFDIVGTVNATQYQRIMGSGEVHVSTAINVSGINVTATVNNTAIAGEVWSYFNRTLTDYNQTLLWNYLNNINTSVSVTIPNLIAGLNNISASDIWTFTNRNLTYINWSDGAVIIWSYYNRTLTENISCAQCNNSDILTAIAGLNNLSAAEVWNFSQRNITGGNLSIMDWATQSDLYNLATQQNITSILNILNGLNNLSAAEVWMYYNRTLTENITTNLTGVLDAISGLNNLSAVQVWNYTTRTLTDYNQTDILNKLDMILFNVSGLSNLTAAEVWNYYNRTLTDYNLSDVLAAINQNYIAINNLSNLTAFQVWNYTNRELTDFNFNLTVNCTSCNTTEILDAISGLNNLSAFEVWNYTNRLLTDYNQTEINNKLDSILFNISGLSNLTASEVWSYYNRTLTDYNLSDVLTAINNNYIAIQGLNNLTAFEVWNYTVRTLTSDGMFNYTIILDAISGLNNLSSSQVWSYVNRTLTDYNQSDILTQIQNNYIAITGLNNLTAFQVWNYTTRTLTDYNQTDIVNKLDAIIFNISGLNNLTAAQVWSYFNRTLTDYNLTSVLNAINTNYLAINGLSNLTAQQVWNYTVRELTNFNITVNATINPADIWNYTNRTLTDYNLSDVIIFLNNINTTVGGLSNTTPQDVWSYMNRTLSNYSGVWSYATRTLTDYNQTDMWIYLQQINSSTYNINQNIFNLNATLYNMIMGLNNISVSDVWNYSGVISSNILNQFVNATWSYVGPIANDILVKFSTNMWTFPYRYTHGEVIEGFP